MSGRSVLFVLTALLTIHLSRGWCGDIYKYVDEQGNVYFTDGQPPGGMNLEKVYSGQDGPEPKEKRADEHSVEEDRFVIPFVSASGSGKAGKQVVVDVTLSRGCRSIRRKFIVDTGATTTVITLEDAKSLGIKEGDVIHSGLGGIAGGGVVVAHRVKLSTLQVADMVVDGAEVAVLREGQTRLLGMDILGMYNMQVDNDHSVLVLQKR